MINYDREIDKKQKGVFEGIFNYALKLEGQAYPKLSINLSFLDREEMHELNFQTRNVDRETDVLSYPLLLGECKIFDDKHFPYDVNYDTGELCLGDIVICKDVALEQSKEYGHSYERELFYLFTHGVLHVLGYDHMQEDEKSIMRAREEEILKFMGIGRDYE